jgi:hypothetical protein
MAMEGMMERMSRWGGANGGCYFFVWGSKLNNNKNTKIKYDVALDGHRLIFYT